MFDDGDSGQLDFNQIQDIKDQAQFSLAIVAMRRGSLEEAKEKLESIRTPWASYYLAKVLREDLISSFVSKIQCGILT